MGRHPVSYTIWRMLSVPWIAGLLVVAPVVNWLRKRSWAERAKGPSLYAAIGAGAGAVALGLGLVLGTPIGEYVSDQAVQWSMCPIVRGSAAAFLTVALIVAVGSLATELVMRGFVVELAREFTKNDWVAVVIGALVEA